jgi:hypothetical protein
MKNLQCAFYSLLLVLFLSGEKALHASEIELSYEKYWRLNQPLYRSDSGDLIGFSFESSPTEGMWDTFLKGQGRFYFQDENALNYSLQEAYVKYTHPDQLFEMSIGRRILDWNPNEKYWSLGFLNANQAFTLLGQEEEGVTGLLVKKTWDNIELEILGSYLFIPQLNPAIDFENGNVKSRSEWVRLPPRKTVLTGVEIPISYNVANYQVEKIIFNKSLGANLKYKLSDQSGLSLFAIYKPENKLRINASAYYDNLVTGKVIVTADPTVNHHAYYGFTLFHGWEKTNLLGGFSYVDPNAKIGKDFLIDISNARKTFRSDFFTINPRYDKEVYSHISLNYSEPKLYDVGLHYIHLFSEDIRGNDDFFSDTVKWKSTVGFVVKYFWMDRLFTLFDIKYDLKRKDNIVKAEAVYLFENQIKLSAGLEMLKAPENSSYWSYYRTADTLYTQIGYVF